MTTYYVRKTGSDAAAGTSAGAAWLTVDKAANTMAAADTVYIGAGIYRELVTMDTSGTSGNVISYIADIDGSQTGDAGLVFVSAFDTDTAASTRASCLDLNGKKFIEWYDVVFDGGTAACVSAASAGDNSYEGIVLDGCVVVAYSAVSTSVYFNFNASATPAGNGPIVRNCYITSGMLLYFDENASALTDWKASIENCIFNGMGRAVSNYAIRILRDGLNTFDAGGCAVNNCTVMGYSYALHAFNCDNATNPIAIANTVVAHCENGFYRLSGTAGSVTSNGGNRFIDVVTAIAGITADGSDDSTGSFGMFGGQVDMPLYRRLGWSPFKPWEPISMSGYTSPLIGAANATYAPAADLYGNPRPMNRADDVGAVEARARPQQESTTVRTDTYAARFEGAGYYDALRPVDAVSTTISAYGQFDANYTGSKPKIEVFEIPGVADQSDIMTGSSGAWEQVSVTFTPTSAGWVRIRLSSQDTSATGESFWDDLEVA